MNQHDEQKAAVDVTFKAKSDESAPGGWMARLIDAGYKVTYRPGRFGDTEYFVKSGDVSVKVVTNSKRARSTILAQATSAQQAIFDAIGKTGLAVGMPDPYEEQERLHDAAQAKKAEQAPGDQKLPVPIDFRGKYPKFASKEAAEAFVVAAREAGDANAFASTLSSVLMTSENTPIVVNVREETVERLSGLSRYGLAIVAFVEIAGRVWPFSITEVNGGKAFLTHDAAQSYIMDGDALAEDPIAALRVQYGENFVTPFAATTVAGISRPADLSAAGQSVA